jgi:hypothetical protein
MEDECLHNAQARADDERRVRNQMDPLEMVRVETFERWRVGVVLCNSIHTTALLGVALLVMHQQ